MSTYYVARVVGEGGYFTLRGRDGKRQCYRTLKAAKAAATRKMWDLGPVVSDCAQVIELENGAPAYLVAMRYYNTAWKEID